MRRYIFILCAFLASCGAMDGEDGATGPAGAPGSKCNVFHKDNKTYLQCDKADPVEIIAGEPGGELPPPSGAVVKTIARCSLKNDLYSVRYNVVALDDKRLASLVVTHLKAPGVFYQGAVLHSPSDEGFAKAEIKLSAWTARLTGEKKAEVQRVGITTTESLVCE